MDYNAAELELLKNPDIQIHRVKTHSIDWFAFRKNGIGSSETALALDPPMHEYGSAAQLFHEKVGSADIKQFDNSVMFWGRAHEPKILEVWEYYDGNPDSYIANYNEGNKIRTAHQTSYVTNKKYPWLFSSPDSLIMPPFVNMMTGELVEKVGNLECKTLSYHAAKKWENKIPVYHIIQIHQQMIVMDIDYSEIAILRDGNKFEVYPVERNEKLAQRIIQQTHDFWYKRVMPARELYVKAIKEAGSNRFGDYDFAKYEPEPDSTKAYEEFQRSQFVDTGMDLKAELKDLHYAKLYKWYLMAAGVIDKEKQRIRNYFLNRMIKNGYTSINLYDMGYVRVTEDRFSLNFKSSPSEVTVSKLIQKLPKNY